MVIPGLLSQLLLALPFTGLWVPRAWDNLLRRTRAMYRAPREFDPKLADPDYVMPDGTAHKDPDGAMALFLDELGRTVEETGMRVTVIAHSMGAMVANEALRHAATLPYESLVYMAPACGIRDFSRAVQPVLQHGAGNTEAFVLTLHPRVEAGQRDVKGFVGPGSVLEWLEGILSPPHTYLDRMLGRWDNLLRSLQIVEDPLRELIHIKGFEYDGKNRVKPYKHVHFNDEDVPFWTRRFWQP
jgi:pimeloyl-ACP methyl ester carboxylesterase